MRGTDITKINYYPASDLFQHVQRIFSGCGFNLMNETEAFRDKHHFIPFPRKYDNQFMRAAKRKQRLLTEAAANDYADTLK